MSTRLVDATERDLLTLYAVAEEFGCSIASVKRRVSSGVLPVFRDGRLVRVRRADLDAYIAARTSANGARRLTEDHSHRNGVVFRDETASERSRGVASGHE